MEVSKSFLAPQYFGHKGIVKFDTQSEFRR